MSEIIKQSLFSFVKLLPASSTILYESAKLYVDRFNGDNNSDPETNGEYRFLAKNSSSFSMVFDVGANVGDWTSRFLQFNNDATVYCFEPVAKTFDKLKSRNFADNVILNNCGLGSKIEQVPIYIFDEDDGLNSIFQRKGLEKHGIRTPDKKQLIQIETIDDYVIKNGIENIDLMKLDVEGYEYQVFLGMKKTLSQAKVKAIQFEYGGCNIDAKVLLKDLFEFFEQYSYRFFKIMPKGLKSYPRYSQFLENFQYQNWLIVRDDVELR